MVAVMYALVLSMLMVSNTGGLVMVFQSGYSFRRARKLSSSWFTRRSSSMFLSALLAAFCTFTLVWYTNGLSLGAFLTKVIAQPESSAASIRAAAYLIKENVTFRDCNIRQ